MKSRRLEILEVMRGLHRPDINAIAPLFPDLWRAQVQGALKTLLKENKVKVIARRKCKKSIKNTRGLNVYEVV